MLYDVASNGKVNQFVRQPLLRLPILIRKHSERRMPAPAARKYGRWGGVPYYVRNIMSFSICIRALSHHCVGSGKTNLFNVYATICSTSRLLKIPTLPVEGRDGGEETEGKNITEQHVCTTTHR